MLLARLKGAIRRVLLQSLRWSFAYGAFCTVEAWLLGRKLRVEICSKCQLKCPSCATARGETRAGAVAWGELSPDNFSRILARVGPIRLLEISNWGEIFLNRRLPEILERAQQAGVTVTVSNGVNLNTASDAALEALVRYHVRELTVSIDGASPQTYAVYRINGDLARVLANVDRINHFKRMHGSNLPTLTWQFVVFGHNEHEIDAARTMAAARDMQFRPIRNLDAAYAPLRDPLRAAARTGIDLAVSTDTTLDALATDLGFCHQLWDAPQINWNGALLGCCFNNTRAFGNVLETPLAKLLAGRDYRYMQNMLLGRTPLRDDLPCVKCRMLPPHLRAK
jgi:MoaA/NifB/PqqE/SkfB family radical SAM enzyme